jgi:hypothetical protein
MKEDHTDFNNLTRKSNNIHFRHLRQRSREGARKTLRSYPDLSLRKFGQIMYRVKATVK